MERIKQQAIDNAVKSGADRATTRIADVNILPVQVPILSVSTYMVSKLSSLFIQYVTNQATRFIVAAIGELAGGAEHVNFNEDLSGIDEDNDASTAAPIVHNPRSKNEQIDYKLYKPAVVGDDWIVSETDLCMDLDCFKKVDSVAY